MDEMLLGEQNWGQLSAVFIVGVQIHTKES
jgi:hypothetical protein